MDTAGCLVESTPGWMTSRFLRRSVIAVSMVTAIAISSGRAQENTAFVSPISQAATEMRLASAETSIRTSGGQLNDVPSSPAKVVGRRVVTSALPDLPPPETARELQASRRLGGRDIAWWATRLGGGFGLFLAIMIVQKLFVSGAQAPLPAGAIQVCGKVPLDSKQSLHLVLIGQRLLVLLESPHGMQRLAEICDPEEVQRLVGPQRQIVRTNAKTPRGNGEETAPTVSDVLSRFREFQSQLG